MGKLMERLIAYCGIRCETCPGYKATIDDDDELRAKTAAEWSKQFGADIKPEHINCVGCTVADGAHIYHWNECGIRKCCSDRGYSNCAYCDDFECEQLTKFLDMVEPARATLVELRNGLDSA
jgi:hypothetical protein